MRVFKRRQKRTPLEHETSICFFAIACSLTRAVLADTRDDTLAIESLMMKGKISNSEVYH
jgi:hypothetical protein